MATWVGIDDGGLQNLEQIGTEAFCRAGTTSPTYLEWYEMYPQPQVEIRTIRAGDHFSATVTRRGSSWTLAIRDVSAKRTFTTRQTRDGVGRSRPSGSSRHRPGSWPTATSRSCP